MKYLPWIIVVVVLTAIIFRKNIAKLFNGNAAPHAAGTGCTTNDNKQGIYDANGVCVATGGAAPQTDSVQRVILDDWRNTYFIGRRRIKYYPKTPGVACAPRIWDSSLGWGSYYAPTSTATSCCYIF